MGYNNSLLGVGMYFFSGGKFEWSLRGIVGHGGIGTKFS
jgi:hypothetical protein